MNNMLKYMLSALLVIALVGCTTVEKKIKTESQSVKTDVFTEVRNEEPPFKGFSNLAIKASIKTHNEVLYIYESKESLHGKPGYPFLLNIDGQAVTWKVNGQNEITPRYDRNLNKDPEGGDGVKYVLDKKILLAAGPHKIFFGLPGENYFKAVDIILNEGENRTLEFRPVYDHWIRRKHVRSFFYGIKNYVVFLDGKLVQ